MKIRGLCGALALVLLPGCTTIKTWFPDKEKNYQFQTEIPPLILPGDLQAKATNETGAGKSLPPSFTPPPPGDNLRKLEDPRDERLSDITRMARVEYQGGAVGLRIFDRMGYSWRLVGKALARESVEIVARNRREGTYLVHYQPGNKLVTDETFWDEVMFFLGRYNVGGDVELQIKLIENTQENYVDVLVVDARNQPDTREPALQLIDALQTTLRQELAR